MDAVGSSFGFFLLFFGIIAIAFKQVRILGLLLTSLALYLLYYLPYSYFNDLKKKVVGKYHSSLDNNLVIYKNKTYSIYDTGNHSIDSSTWQLATVDDGMFLFYGKIKIEKAKEGIMRKDNQELFFKVSDEPKKE